MAWIIVLPSKSERKEFHFLFITFLDKSCQDQGVFFCQDAIIANYKFLSFLLLITKVIGSSYSYHADQIYLNNFNKSFTSRIHSPTSIQSLKDVITNFLVTWTHKNLYFAITKYKNLSEINHVYNMKHALTNSYFNFYLMKFQLLEYVNWYDTRYDITCFVLQTKPISWIVIWF